MAVSARVEHKSLIFIQNDLEELKKRFDIRHYQKPDEDDTVQYNFINSFSLFQM